MAELKSVRSVFSFSNMVLLSFFARQKFDGSVCFMEGQAISWAMVPFSITYKPALANTVPGSCHGLTLLPESRISAENGINVTSNHLLQ